MRADEATFEDFQKAMKDIYDVEIKDFGDLLHYISIIINLGEEHIKRSEIAEKEYEKLLEENNQLRKELAQLKGENKIMIPVLKSYSGWNNHLAIADFIELLHTDGNENISYEIDAKDPTAFNFAFPNFKNELGDLDICEGGTLRYYEFSPEQIHNEDFTYNPKEAIFSITTDLSGESRDEWNSVFEAILQRVRKFSEVKNEDISTDGSEGCSRE